jgi:2-dehydropantoate 2-reductase
MSEGQSVAVVGVGSVGGFFASQAWRAGNRLTLCVRTSFPRLVVETGEVLEVDAEVHTDPERVQPHDWVLLATKAHQTETAAPWLSRLCRAGTVVVVLQNGVEQVERVSPHSGDAEILPAVVHYGGEVVEPGRIRHYTKGHLYVPDVEAGRRLADLFAGTGAGVRLTPQFEVEAWGKLVINVAANAIPALTGRRFPVLRRPEVAELALGLMRECVAVAAAMGIELSPTLPETELARLAGLPDHVGSSMLYDRLAGRSLEYDALNGAVVRAGNRHGVPTPLNQAMVALLAAIGDQEEQ